MTAAELELRPDPKHLALLASNMRGWDYEEIYSAILAAGHAGWSFEQVFREVVRLVLIADSGPADLRAKAAKPTLAPARGISEETRKLLAAAKQDCAASPVRAHPAEKPDQVA